MGGQGTNRHGTKKNGTKRNGTSSLKNGHTRKKKMNQGISTGGVIGGVGIDISLAPGTEYADWGQEHSKK